MTISANSAVTKKDTSRVKKPRRDTYSQIEDNSSEDEEENNDDIPQIICTSVPCHTKFKSSHDIKAYFIVICHTL